MKLHLNQEKGFTLVELLVGMVIMVLIMGGLSTLFASSVKVHSTSTAKTSNIKDANTAVNNIVDELKYAISQNVIIITPGTGVTRTNNAGVNSINSYSLTIAGATDPIPAASYTPVTITNTTATQLGGLQFTRNILLPTANGGNGVLTGYATRRIRLVNNTAVMDYGPVNTAQANPWTIIRSIDLSTGTDLVATAALSGIPKYSGSIQSLTFTIEQMPDTLLTDFTERRKKITVTVVANANGLNAGPQNDTLNTAAADMTARSASSTTTVITNN